MGFFSFITSDTNTSIPNIHSRKPIFPVYMVTEDGQIFEEKEYDGYGVFGGKDIYILIAELNNLCPNGTQEDKRMAAIDLMYKTIITNGTTEYIKGKDFTNWNKEIPGINRSANELTQMHGWEKIYPNGYGDFNVAAKKGIKLPKLFEDRVSINNWEQQDYPVNCPEQGYFYELIEEET
jgi:hypothetical protein